MGSPRWLLARFFFFNFVKNNKTDSVCVTQHEGESVKQLLLRKAMCITYSECVFLALGIQHAMRMRRIVVCCLDGCTIFLQRHKYTRAIPPLYQRTHFLPRRQETTPTKPPDSAPY